MTTSNTLVWGVPEAWLQEFAEHRVRTAVLQALMKDNAFGLLVNVLASALFAWAYPDVRANTWLCAVLLLWCSLAVWSYRAEINVKLLFQDELLTPAQSWHYLRLYITSSVLQTCCLATLVVFFMLRHAQGFMSLEVIGGLFYYFGSIMKDFSVRLLNIAYTLVLLPPMAVFYVLQGDVAGFVVAGFIIIFCFGAIQFAGNMGSLMVSNIQLRYSMEELTQNLMTERDRADSANAAKSRFFTAASHDARQPLQAIALLFAGLVKSPSISTPDRILIEKIAANLHTIRNLFDRVLDISRIESGSVAPNFQAIALQPMFNSLEMQFGEFATSKGLWLRFRPTQAVVWHDADLLERMLGNLVHNALKFTPHGGVWVGYRMQQQQIEVRDSGVGITTAAQAHIFEAFYQTDNSARKRDLTAGLGLGLSIVKLLAEVTHTPIRLRSERGRGSTFSLQLQIPPPLPAVAVPQCAAVPLAPVVEASSLQGLSLLFVEDDDELRDLFAEALRELGVQVSGVGSAPLAFRWLQKQQAGAIHFDALLTDYRLGDGGSGVDVARRVRQYRGDSFPVIVLTGDTSGEGFAALVQHPYTWTLHKPVTIDQLAAALQKVR
ncbi:ATP-binding response regulator [Thiothrix lacustris]|uniref:ATP-binding response regulator n=1 Tax=Thiothrix lacustris TaxID=525917 RepID=UPI0027E40221|nr:hybrid sensor histidine kinase/response regulator [Thiothrix lacustris]WMP18995.1 hybrid sensor histidine kinase/response regulator [Thiothrix lacustris]